MSHDFVLFPELTNSQMEIYYFESPHRQITENFRAKVIRVIDGDTIKVRWEGRDFDFKVRFLNINAPELNELGGNDSKYFLRDRIEGNFIDVEINPKNRVDKWGRLLGNIIFNGTDMGEEEILFNKAVDWDTKDEGKILPLERLISSG